MRIFVVSLVVSLVGCSSASPDQASPISCEEPPAAEIDAPSDLEMSVDPNPASPRAEVQLAVSSEGLPVDGAVGVDAGWQCWNGSQWVTTHVMYRGFGDHAGQTIPVNSEFQIRVPSIGLALDQGYPVVVPQVATGTYRILDEVIADETVSGFVLVEVVG